MEQVDTLINAGWIVPVEPAGQVLTEHSLALRDGNIEAVLPHAAASERYRPQSVFDLPQHVLLPGLVNAHTHAAMTLFRGLADDLPLMSWLGKHIWPAEQAHISPEFVRCGSELGVAEMLRGGITCFSDMYFFPEVTARVASRAGMRVAVGMIAIDFPSAYAETPDEYLKKGLALHDAYRHEPLVTTMFAPHSPYTVSPRYLERIRTLADELDVPVHIHLHETAGEVQHAVEQTGQRPLAALDELGLLSPGLIAVHMTQLTETELDRVAAAGAHVVHCPESNLKLASGFCPVAALLQRGVNVALGTDGAASNNDLDLFGEMRTAALLAKAVAKDAAAVPAPQALHMATLGGASALGLADRIGSLAPGKEADVLALDLSAPESQPIYNPVSQVVYASARHQVTDVWVAGRHVVSAGELTNIDVPELQQHARHWRDTILS